MKARKAVYSVVVILLLIGGFVIGDYFALFGVKTDVRLDFAEGTFRIVDAETGNPVVRVIARCVQQFNENACTQRNSGKMNVVSIHVPMKRIVTESFLFSHSDKIEKPVDPNINIIFIHPDYREPFRTYRTEDFFTGKFDEYPVKMTSFSSKEAAKEVTVDE